MISCFVFHPDMTFVVVWGLNIKNQSPVLQKVLTAQAGNLSVPMISTLRDLSRIATVITVTMTWMVTGVLRRKMSSPGPMMSKWER